jgi:XRE family transcriptional regulator, fatty acid utilization regulator
MSENMKRKLLAGAQVRKLRNELGLSQTSMANEIGVSVSYLNLVERNQRPLSAQFLIKLNENYAIDLRNFSEETELRELADLNAMLSHSVFENIRVPKQELRTVLEQAPSFAAAARQLFAAYTDSAAIADTGSIESGRGEFAKLSRSAETLDQVRAFLHDNQNYFSILEDAAEETYKQLRKDGSDLYPALIARLQERHGIRIQIVTVSEMASALRHFDRHRKRLMLSERLSAAGRFFQAAYQLGLVEHRAALDEACKTLVEQTPQAAPIAHITMANYFAGALIMPYGLYHAAAENLAYDVEALAARFGVSFEQAAHRLTTLARPSARGIPLFMLRVDCAGNVSKRFSSGSFPFARIGGTCPRWNLHSTFRSPERIETQVIEVGGKSWLSIARTVRRASGRWGEPEAQFAVGLGCEARFASRIVYFRDIPPKQLVPTQIGVNCRLCERPNCLERSAPSRSDKLNISERTRGISPFGI